jgi:hypothetical protein
MNTRSRYFDYIGNSTALLRGYKWLLIERYHFETQSGSPLLPTETLEFYLNDHAFFRSFYELRVKDIPDVHGPYWAEKISSLGLAAYEPIESIHQFVQCIESILHENFGNPADRSANERHRYDNARRTLEESVSSQDSVSIFRLRTEDMVTLEHDSAFVLDYFTEFVLINPVAGELQTCVIAAD